MVASFIELMGNQIEQAIMIYSGHYLICRFQRTFQISRPNLTYAYFLQHAGFVGKIATGVPRSTEVPGRCLNYCDGFFCAQLQFGGGSCRHVSRTCYTTFRSPDAHEFDKKLIRVPVNEACSFESLEVVPMLCLRLRDFREDVPLLSLFCSLPRYYRLFEHVFVRGTITTSGRKAQNNRCYE
jgi:hypothetical protein